MMRIVWRAGAVLVLGIVASVLTAAQGPGPAPAPVPARATAPLPLTALAQLEAGLWRLESKGLPPRQLCLADGSELIQVVHDQSGCSRFVVANEARSATVHYSCQAAGWGRTTVRVETPRSAQVQTQGIAKNAPFDYTLAARRVGACASQLGAR